MCLTFTGLSLDLQGILHCYLIGPFIGKSVFVTQSKLLSDKNSRNARGSLLGLESVFEHVAKRNDVEGVCKEP